MVKINNYKPANLLTHPAITEYELSKGAESLSFFKVLSVCVGITGLVWAAVVVLAMINDKPEAVKESQYKPYPSKPRYQPREWEPADISRVEYTERVN